MPCNFAAKRGDRGQRSYRGLAPAAFLDADLFDICNLFKAVVDGGDEGFPV